jgi:hypothetical protein
MSIYEFGNSGASPEDERPKELLGGYPYGNLSVSAMARHLNERIYGHPDGPAAPTVETELPEDLEQSEAEAA